MKFPVSADGGVQHFPESYWSQNPEQDPDPLSEFGQPERQASVKTDPDWREAEPFFAAIGFQAMEHGIFWWKDGSTGATYPMFMTDLVDLIRRRSVYLGVAAERWIPCKRGSGYGIKLAT